MDASASGTAESEVVMEKYDTGNGVPLKKNICICNRAWYKMKTAQLNLSKYIHSADKTVRGQIHKSGI